MESNSWSTASHSTGPCSDCFWYYNKFPSLKMVLFCMTVVKSTTSTSNTITSFKTTMQGFLGKNLLITNINTCISLIKLMSEFSLSKFLRLKRYERLLTFAIVTWGKNNWAEISFYRPCTHIGCFIRRDKCLDSFIRTKCKTHKKGSLHALITLHE